MRTIATDQKQTVARHQVDEPSEREQYRIELLNESGQVAKAWNCFRCWVSEYTALGELDANANAVVFETVVLQNEGWERDYDVAEPTEPKYEEPTP